MQPTAKTHRRKAYRKPAVRSSIHLEMNVATGAPRRVNADIVDLIDGGIGLALTTPMESGSIVVVRGTQAENGTAGEIKAVVRWCAGNADGTFRAGLEFLALGSSFTGQMNRGQMQQTNSSDSDTLDCYAVLHLSPAADSAAISRAYRLLALRYHPDNIQTGDSEMFLRLSEAHEILSDPRKRVAYDSRRRATRRFDRNASSFPGRPKASNANGDRSVSCLTKETTSHFRDVGALGGWDAALRAL